MDHSRSVTRAAIAIVVELLTGISIFNSDLSSHRHQGFANAKFETEFVHEGPFHYAPTDQLCLALPKAPETGVFPTELSDTYPFSPYPSPKSAVLCKPPILLATAASQFSATCCRKAAASDGSSPATASSNVD